MKNNLIDYILDEISKLSHEQIEKIFGAFAGVITYFVSSFTHPTFNILAQVQPQSESGHINTLIIECTIRAGFAVISGFTVYVLSKLFDKYILKSNGKENKRSNRQTTPK